MVGTVWDAGGYGYQEDETGLRLLGHRYYDASTGRFLTRDPIKDGRNWYSYAYGDPVNLCDPEGLQGSTSTPHGRAVYVRTLIEIAEEEGTRNIGKLLLLQPGTLVRHHVFPQAFRDNFIRAGINIEKFLIEVPDWFHKYLHRGQEKTLWDWLTGNAARGGWWNNQWAEFFKKNPNATAKQCEDFMKQLLDKARIGDLTFK